MYVKTVTLKGFKSFASATTLRLEPGITCVVGPNGTGKSNVVDALAWVMGEQGARSLRGGKMEDVIFAGTSGRPPLGRAEVSLTIDNTDGALPVDYSEVTISRTMFRGGGSEYALNGTPCRLLDIQELLSDSGIGREMHVIVGQGQLDAVLRAAPQERRGLIEEAAGVLKHRTRKERALRKLDAVQGNLTRLEDLTAELRRQLGPLGRQAQTARQAASIQAEVRDARLRLLADDVAAVTAALERDVAEESALQARRAQVEAALATVEKRLADATASSDADRAQLQEAQERWFTLVRLGERFAAAEALAGERERLLSETGADPAGADPERLREQARALRSEHGALLAEVDTAASALAAASAEREAAESCYATEREQVARLARAEADRREGLATLAGQVAAAASRVEAGEAELGRLHRAGAASVERARDAEREFAALETRIAADEAGEPALDAEHEAALAELERLRREQERATAAERSAERDRQAAQATTQALALSLSGKDGAAAVLNDGVPGVLGTFAAALQVAPADEAALSAALGWAADAVLVDSLPAALAALAALRTADAGRAGLLVDGQSPPLTPDGEPDLGAPARWARDLVECHPSLRPTVDSLLHRVAVVPGDEEALELVSRHPDVTAVTAAGDLFAVGAVRGGSSGLPSRIAIQAALDEANAALHAATAQGERARFTLAGLRGQIRAAEDRAQAALERLHESDARMAALAERLGHLGGVARAARAEAHRTERAIAAVTGALDKERAQHAALVQRLEAAGAQAPEVADQSSARHDELEAMAAQARARETEARLRLRTLEERARALHERAGALGAAATAELAARQQRALLRDRRRQQAQVAAAVREAAASGVERLGAWAQAAEGQRRAAEQGRAEREAELAALRREADHLQEQLRTLTESVHRDQVARAEHRLRLEGLHAKASEELGIDPGTLVDEFGPHRQVPQPSDPGTDGEQPPVPFVRAEQERRLRAAERRLVALGRVNPLALEEYAALEERHAFLVRQVADLKQSRRDLLGIVEQVDAKVRQAFADAFRDVAREFHAVFSRLFPGGEGRLELTDPQDLLTTGIDVYARPAGKRIKALSLLSGGERALVAVALLLAIFKARPSPFYVMDEVEAALDETNLSRLLALFDELRESSQLLVVTHQKKTMEIADALYGVSMRGDGVTTVVSQRLRDVAVPA